MTGIDNLKSDLNLARQFNAPVLITAPDDFALRVARVIAAQTGPRSVLKVCDVPGVPDVVWEGGPGASAESDTVLAIRGVHALDRAGQKALLRVLDNPSESGYRRVVAMSPVNLYELVRQGLFSDILYYRLNAIHITGGGRLEWDWLSSRYGSDGQGCTAGAYSTQSS